MKTGLLMVAVLTASFALPVASAQSPGVQEGIVTDGQFRIMAQYWIGRNVTLALVDSSHKSGRLSGLHGMDFHMRQGEREIQFPLADIQGLVVHRDATDLTMAGLTSLGLGGLLAGIAFVGFDAPAEQVVAMGVAGVTVGGIVGWRVFYKDVVVWLRR